MDNFSTFQDYKSDILLKKDKADDDFRSHLITFLAVNAGIFLLNMMTSASFPWFLFVFGGWGIGIVSHWANKYVAKKNADDVNKIDDMDIDELKELIYINKKRSYFYVHLITSISICLFLIMINLITSSGFMWSLIPCAGMFVGIASHWGKYTNKSRRSNINIPEDINSNSNQENSQIKKAEHLKETIIGVIMEIREKFKNFASDILPKIDSYVNTIGLLTTKLSDLENILSETSIENLTKERDELLIKRENAESPVLTHEYDKLIEDVLSHISTIKNLEEQKELLELKTNNAINNLKQLHLELVGMKSKTTFEDTSILDDFEEKSSELALYYKDLLESYDEVYKS